MTDGLENSVSVADDQLIVDGPILFENVMRVMQAGVVRIGGRRLEVDFTHVTEVDSSAVSMLLEWLRTAQAKGCQLRLVNLPENLRSLIKLYDVVDLLPLDDRNPS
ncbi:phospholipid transport system transporter-binding protein [Nitrosomonas halophila]|uniref:Phospholipid transport system transporter-binding protein n=1 Tax=Nitrosomonas halophila TaxID=44576 RepID=A0A1H3GI16_9PROT|nr:phospholipid transport system transporter-binding protein [Nitrosomonas halophila]